MFTLKRAAIFSIIAFIFSLSFGWRTNFFSANEPLQYFAGVPTARGAISLVQTTNATTGGSGGTSVAATFGTTPTSGNLLVAIGGARSATTLSLSASGWTQVAQDTATVVQAIFYKIATSSEATAITLNSTANVHLGLHIYEYSGIETTTIVDGVASSSGSGTAIGSGVLSTVQPDDLILSGMVVSGQTSFTTSTNSFIIENNFANGNGTPGNRATYGGLDRIVSSAGSYNTTGTVGASGSWLGHIVAFRANIDFNQSAYRWFNNANATSVGSPLAAQDTAATVLTPGTPARLRMLIRITGVQLAASEANFKLQFVGKGSGTCASPSGGTPASYTDVATSTGIFHFYDNSNPVDGAALSATGTDPVNGGDTIVNESYEEANNFTNAKGAVLVNQDGKWDFSLVDNGAAAGATYCFRAVEVQSSTVFTTYTSYPQIVVGNIAPTVDLVTLNGGSDIALTEGTTTLVQATATVTDANGFADISSAIGRIFKTSLGSGCTLDNNNCYADNACTLAGCSGNSCVATCSAKIWYFAEPTDTGTPYATDTWSGWVQVTDASNATGTATSSAIELLTTLGIKAGPSINYGSLSPGSSTNINQLTVVTSTGNASMDVTVYGADMTSGGNSISLGKQKYATSSVNYASGTALIANPGAPIDLNMKKTTSSSTPATSTIYWGIAISSTQPTGVYAGNNTFIGVVNALPWP